MNTQKDDACREAFEKWATENDFDLVRHADEAYATQDCFDAWTGWQAAWNARAPVAAASDTICANPVYQTGSSRVDGVIQWFDCSAERYAAIESDPMARLCHSMRILYPAAPPSDDKRDAWSGWTFRQMGSAWGIKGPNGEDALVTDTEHSPVTHRILARIVAIAAISAEGREP